MPAPTVIVNVDEVLNEQVIRNEQIRMADLIKEDTLALIKRLAKRRLLRNSLICLACQQSMSFIRRGQCSDGFTWKCKICNSSVSIRRDSFFAHSNLTLQQIIIIMYGWARDFQQKDIAYEAGIPETSFKTMVDWCNFCRDVCEQYLIDHPMVTGGLNDDGTSKIVEIDETKFFHRKYHRGQWREGHWVFGGIERGTGKCFLVEVPDRTAETLTAIIQQYILPGTIIMSDGWRAYNNINTINGGVYEHHVIIHQENFVDPHDANIHTQTVENMWMRAKRKLRRQFGTPPNLFS